MIMQDNEKKPALRFKGFTDPWEQRKVGTLIEDYTEKTVTQNQYPVLTSSQQQGIVLQEDYFADRQVTTDNNVGYYVLPKGYFTYRSRSDTDVFVFNRNNIVDKGIISYYYPVFAPKSCDSNFLLRRLNHGIKKQLSMAAEGTGQKVLAHAKFKNMVVDVPSQSEQEKIGTILEELDTLITLHQRKYEKLVNIKKSMLDKMFPKNGASVPEIRFKGFTDPWEQRKLGDITVELSEYATQELGLPLLTSSRSGLMYQDEYRDSRTTKSTETLFSVVPVGTCTYRHMSDDDVFHMNINTLEKGLVSREYPVFEASKGNNLEFLVQHINSSEEFKAFCAEQKKGGTRTRLYYNTLCQFTVRVPALKEQAQISQCLKKLDTLITLHQRKLEKLQNIKKSCLEKMFV